MLQVTGLTATTPDGAVVLDDVSFSVQPGWVVAVMGPTGAGKTSLLNALSGRVPAVAGRVTLDGVDVLAGDEATRRRIGFVPQDDLLHPQLDLRRTMGYAAWLRSGPDVDATDRAARVDAVLAELGLTDQADQPVSTLSGGQRRRAGVAVELVGAPDVLVLDEPTAGLDPGSEKSVLAMLRQLADRGRTVLTVTHSLQALAVCDRVLFLAPGGRVAFFGRPAEAQAYFRGAGPADVFLALGREPGDTWKERFRGHPSYVRNVERGVLGLVERTRLAAGRSPIAHRGSRTQLAILVRRYVDIIRADRRMVALLALQGPLLGAILAAVLRPDSLAVPGPGSATVALFLAVSVSWVGTAAATREIVKEQRIFRQERGTGVSIGAYVGSKALTLGLLTIVEAAFLTWIAASRQSPPAHGAVFTSGLLELVVGSALVGVAAVAIGLLLSAAVDTPDKALTLLPIVLVTQLVLSGSWVSAGSVPGLGLFRSLTGAHWGVRLVDATVAGDAGAWWSAAASLAALTTATLLATAALVHRRVRPARPAVPLAQHAVVLLPRLAPAALAVLAVTGMGAGSFALVEARSSRPPVEQPAEPARATTTTAPPLLAPSPLEPTTTTTAPAPTTTVPPPSANPAAGGGRDEEVAAPLPGLIDGVGGAVRDVVQPVTDVVDEVVSPPTTVAPTPTTVPAPVVTVPAANPVNPLQALMELAIQWYALTGGEGFSYRG